jgi:Outer membrane protein beta-barrel domain
MKKIAALFIIFCTIITISNAQSYYQFKGGFSLSQTKLNSNHKLEVDKMPGFHAGISFRLPFYDRFYVQTELLYTRKGYVAKDRSINYEIRSNPSYLQLPVLLGSYIVLGSSYKVFLHTGAHVSIGMGGENIIIDNEKEVSNSIKWGFNPLNSYYDPYDIGYIIGAGLEFEKFNFEISYDIGLKEVASGNFAETEMFTRCLHISVGFIIEE